MYGPAIGRGAVEDFIRSTGVEAMMGADILATAPGQYRGEEEYLLGNIGGYMRDMVQVHNANLGTRVFFTTAPYNIFDTHANQPTSFAKLWGEVSRAVNDLYQDLKEHDANQEVVMVLFTEFGRRVQENGSGTDHGSGSVAFVLGDAVKGGLYGEYPSLEPDKLDEGDLKWNNDFRQTYATILDKWLELDDKAILQGEFEQFDFIK